MTYEDKTESGQKKPGRIFLPDSINCFGERLRIAMKGESNNSFAKKCGWSEKVIRNYLNGESYPSLDRLAVISSAADCSIAWLATGVDDSDKKPRNDFFEEEFALIPGYDVQVSTGNGTTALDERKPSRYLAFRRKWLSYRGFSENDLVLLWAKGDSMEPTISNNDTLVVNTTHTKPVDGNIYVIRHEDNLWAKRVQVQPGAWLLISDNQPVYPPIEIKREDMANFEVIGQVVHISKDVGI